MNLVIRNDVYFKIIANYKFFHCKNNGVAEVFNATDTKEMYKNYKEFGSFETLYSTRVKGLMIEEDVKLIVEKLEK